MVLIKKPVTKNGQLRYGEIIKVFFFVMFLFALYSTKIQNIVGFNTAFTLSSSIIVIFIILMIIIQLITDCLELYHYIIDAFSKWISNQHTTWKRPKIDIISIIEQVIDYITTKQTQAVYCVFRC